MIPMTPRESNMQPSGLYRSVSTNCTPLLSYDKQKSKVVKIIFCINPFEHSIVCDETGLAKSVQYAVVCETVETSMLFACNSSFLSVDGMTCLKPFES